MIVIGEYLGRVWVVLHGGKQGVHAAGPHHLPAQPVAVREVAERKARVLRELGVGAVTPQRAEHRRGAALAGEQVLDGGQGDELRDGLAGVLLHAGLAPVGLHRIQDESDGARAVEALLRGLPERGKTGEGAASGGAEVRAAAESA